MRLTLNQVSSIPKTTTILSVYVGLLIVWTLYRAFTHNSIWVEELFIKGIIFLLPFVVLPLYSSQPFKDLGLTTTNFFKSVCVGVGVGLLLGLAGVLINYIRYQDLAPSFFRGLSAGQIGAYLILAIITAFWEQLLFSGYFLHQLKWTITKEVTLVGLVGIMFSLIHLPAFVFIQHQSPPEMIVNLLLLVALGAGCAILQLRTKNLIAPIMAHVLWGVTLFIFR